METPKTCLEETSGGHLLHLFLAGVLLASCFLAVDVLFCCCLFFSLGLVSLKYRLFLWNEHFYRAVEWTPQKYMGCVSVQSIWAFNFFRATRWCTLAWRFQDRLMSDMVFQQRHLQISREVLHLGQKQICDYPRFKGVAEEWHLAPRALSRVCQRGNDFHFHTKTTFSEISVSCTMNLLFLSQLTFQAWACLAEEKIRVWYISEATS